jgi:hypothetical protein
MIAALAYFPGTAALAVAYFYTVGALVKITELRGGGFSVSETLPLTPIPQLLALGVSTVSVGTVVILILLGAMVGVGVLAERAVLKLRAQESAAEAQLAAAESKTEVAEAPAADRTEPTEPTEPRPSMTEAQLRAELTEMMQRAENASLGLDELADNRAATERLLSQADAAADQAIRLAKSGPRGIRGYIRHPLGAVRRRRELARTEQAWAWVTDERRRATERDAQVAAARQMILSHKQRISEMRTELAVTRARTRKARIAFVSIGIVIAILTIGTALIVPPISAVVVVLPAVYLLVFVVSGRARTRMIRLRPTVFAFVLIGLITLGLVLQSFITPRRLATVQVQTDRGTISGLLIAATDAETTVGLADCQIETLPELQIKAVLVRAGPRPSEKSVGTLLLNLLGSRHQGAATHHPYGCANRG